MLRYFLALEYEHLQIWTLSNYNFVDQEDISELIPTNIPLKLSL